MKLAFAFGDYPVDLIESLLLTLGIVGKLGGSNLLEVLGVVNTYFLTYIFVISLAPKALALLATLFFTVGDFTLVLIGFISASSVSI